MGKLSEAERRANYVRLRALFDAVVPDHARFTLVYATGVDVGLCDSVMLCVRVYTYTSYAVGFDAAANEIVVVPVARDLATHGRPLYLRRDDITAARREFASRQIRVSETSLPQGFVSFSVRPRITRDPEAVALLVSQEAEARQFKEFFRSYRK